MYDQTLHQKGILQGNLSRIPPKAHDYFRENHYLNSLLYVNEFDPNLNDASQFLDRLVEDNIRYIVIHKNLVGQNRIDHWQRYLLIEPVYEDGRLIVYATETQSSQNTILQNELYPGLGVVDSNSIASCLLPNDIFELTIGWRVTDKQTAPLEAVFELQSENRQTSQSERFLINGKPWEKGTSTWGNYLFRLNEQLMAGTYSIRLGVAQKDQQPGRWHLIDTFSIQPRGNSHCELTESGLTPSGAVFGEQIRLVSYKANQNDSAVILDLAWQADQRIGQEYTVFLHLFDPNVGTPVAQSDAPPRQNSLPTRFWWPGEIITDTIVIPLNSVPQGEYRLALGIYLPETGERLNLKTPSGFSVEDNRLILDSTITIE